MGSIISKASILEEILKIEDEIKQIKKDSMYLRILRSLKNLENVRIGDPFVTAPSPDDMDTHVKLRRRSKEMKETISRYRERQSEFEEIINRLYNRKKNLEEKLFA